MKHFSFKRVLAIVLTLALVMTLLPMTVSATGTDASSIAVLEDGSVALTLEYGTTYYDTKAGDAKYETADDIHGATLNLINAALDTYNSANGTALAISDIDNLTVKTAADVRITSSFPDILKAKLPQLVEIDMSESAVTQNRYSTDNGKDHWLADNYFYGLNSVKKVVLPKDLLVLRSGSFSSMPNLEEVVIGDALEEMGFAAFYGCPKLTRIDLPASLKILSSVGQFFKDGGIKEFSFHGLGENAADKTAFFTTLTAGFLDAGFTWMDLSYSGIDETNALKIASKATLAYLDLRGCESINFATPDGQALEAKLQELKANGVTVYMPNDNEPTEDMSSITVSDDVVTLDLYFYNTYYDTNAGDAKYETANDIHGATLNLIETALDTYNTENGTALTIADIDNLKVRTATAARLTYCFPDILKAKLPQLVEIDMSGAAVTRNRYETDNLDDHWLRDEYFMTMSNLKKVVLPNELLVLRAASFSGLENLEEVVIGNALEEMGYAVFYDCKKLTKIDLPDTLCRLSSIGIFFEGSGVKEFSFHGSAENAADKAAFFNILFNAFNQVNYTKVDLKGSGIDEKAARLVVKKAGLTYIDIRDCENIDFTNLEGSMLYNELQALKENNVTVLMPDYTPPANPDGPVDKGDIFTLEVEGDEVRVNIEYHNTYYDTGSSVPYRDYGDIRGFTLYMIEKLLTEYNAANGTSFTGENVTHLTVKTVNGAKVTAKFSDLLKNRLYNLVELDMGDVTITTQVYEGQSTSDFADNIVPSKFFGTDSNGTAEMAKLKKLVTPKDAVEFSSYSFAGLKKLEELVIGDKLEKVGGEVFTNTNSLKALNLPDTFYNFASSFNLELYASGIEKVTFHGTAQAADDPEAAFLKIMNKLNVSGYTYLDLSGSGITVDAALLIKSSVSYLDLRDCFNLEYSSDEGQELLALLHELEERGAEVYYPTQEELDTKLLVSARTNDKTMGTVRGTAVYEYTQTPLTHTVTATPVTGYTLIGWQIDDEATLRDPGTPVDGVFSLTLEITKPVKIIGVFEIDSNVTLPEGNTLTVDPETGKFHITLTVSGAGNDNLISIYTQVFIKQKRLETGLDYSAADIASIKLVTKDGFKWTKNFATVLPPSFSNPLKENLVKVDLSETDITSLPAEAFSGFKALSEAILPPNLGEVTYRAFYQTVSLKSIDLPDTVHTIGRECFREGGLVSIELPDGLKTIEIASFGRNANFVGTTGDDGIFVIPDGIEKFNSDWGVCTVLKSAEATADTGATFSGTPVKGIEFHGVGNEASFSRMIASVNWKKSYYDFSNSGITEKQLSLIPFTSPSATEDPRTTYLDIRGCQIDYTTPRGKALKKKLIRYQEENPDVTILWDDGIIRDTSYTEVSAEITLTEGQTMADALTAWETSTGASAATITDLVIKTEGNRELIASDFAKIKEVMLTSLRKVDLSGAALESDTIPDSAFEFVENLFEVKFPEDLKNIGAKAFYATNLMSLTLPKGLEVIGPAAFGECFSIEGELILPNGLKEIGDGAFADAGINRLEYHGPVDLKLLTNFTYGLSTLEYVDLRGCTAITRDNFPTTASTDWGSLKELNLDFCSISDPYVFFFNYFIKSFSTRPTVTLNCQFVPYDSVEEMLKYPIYGKQYDDYADTDGSVIVGDLGIFNMQDVEESEGIKSVITEIIESSDPNADLEWSDIEDFIDDEESSKVTPPTKVKKVVTMYRKLKNNGNDNSWLIWAGIGAGVLLAAGATVIIIILVKRKRKDSDETAMEDISSESGANE